MTGAPPDRAALEAEYAALRHGAGPRRAPRDVVVVSGPEAGAYLQGQLSQDLAPVGVGTAVPSLLLEPDGKLCALVRVTRTADEQFALDVDGGWGEAVAARLRRFRLRTKADVEEVSWPFVALRGTGVARLPAPGRPPWVLPVEWNGTSGVDLLGPGADEAVPEGVVWCGEAAWEALRIEAGIPAMGTELDARTIAAEAGLVERTVSLTKGCYTGQELVARLDARGSRVARRLCGIVLEDPDVGADALAGAELWPAGSDRPAGRCTSAAWCPGVRAAAGLAYLHRSVEVPGVVEWSPAGGPAAGPAVAERRRARAVALPIVAP